MVYQRRTTQPNDREMLANNQLANHGNSWLAGNCCELNDLITISFAEISPFIKSIQPIAWHSKCRVTMLIPCIELSCFACTTHCAFPLKPVPFRPDPFSVSDPQPKKVTHQMSKPGSSEKAIPFADSLKLAKTPIPSTGRLGIRIQPVSALEDKRIGRILLQNRHNSLATKMLHVARNRLHTHPIVSQPRNRLWKGLRR